MDRDAKVLATIGGVLVVGFFAGVISTRASSRTEVQQPWLIVAEGARATPPPAPPPSPQTEPRAGLDREIISGQVSLSDGGNLRVLDPFGEVVLEVPAAKVREGYVLREERSPAGLRLLDLHDGRCVEVPDDVVAALGYGQRYGRTSSSNDMPMAISDEPTIGRDGQ